jgi:hypothetical protein
MKITFVVGDYYDNNMGDLEFIISKSTEYIFEGIDKKILKNIITNYINKNSDFILPFHYSEDNEPSFYLKKTDNVIEIVGQDETLLTLKHSDIKHMLYALNNPINVSSRLNDSKYNWVINNVFTNNILNLFRTKKI